MKKHLISRVKPGSIAEEFNLEPGDHLTAINGREIADYFDYEFYITDDYLEMYIEKADGTELILEIDKDPGEEIGLEFANGMMDEYRSCCNKCIFCFIDQMPKGMRESLYFKDDDSRLSFLHGNYITLTNMSDTDIDRIIRYHMSPIYISFHTTNPELRCRMLGNRFAGEALKKADRLFEAGIEMNGQIVLCKGVNDGGELERTISDLSRYAPFLRSVSVVPVGLTKYREGLYPLKPFTGEDARETIAIIEKWQDKIFKKYGYHFVHASDEFYLLAGKEFPEATVYDGYPQYENGVGMLRSQSEDFKAALKGLVSYLKDHPALYDKKRTVSCATGLLAYESIRKMAEEISKLLPGIKAYVYPIKNEFFGENITVTGLLTGRDIISQLKDKQRGETLLLSECIARSKEPVLLDDIRLSDIEKSLQVKVDIVKSNGTDFIEKVVGETIYEQTDRGSGWTA
ncbi:MAG: DUF512 domain-containing protein [Lachnospiraceae bacterium]|nr:DUF512 domain-containing protein [Lachnospiraceae bacterium]